MQSNLESKILRAIEFIEEDYSPIFIVSHYDTDGLSAALILIKILYNKKIPFVFRTVSSLDEVENVKESAFNRIILIDFQISEEIITLSKYKRILMIDHHQILDYDIYGQMMLLNPYLFQIDGNKDACSSCIAYLLAKSIDESLVYLSPLALAGALEDKQDVAEKRFFLGLNKEIYDEAEEAGICSSNLGLVSYVDFNETLEKTFAYIFEPFIPTIFGNIEKSRKFLIDCGIPNELLSKELRKINEKDQFWICQKVAKKLIKESYEAYNIERIFGLNYEVTGFGKIKNLRSLAKILNYHGRYYKYDTIIRNLITEEIKEGFEESLINYSNEIKKFSEIILNRVKEFNNIAYIDLNDFSIARLTGDFSSLFASSNISKKPLIMISTTLNDNCKVSIRLKGNFNNVNIGELVKTVAKKINCKGGGHVNSAGAIIPKSLVKKFIDELDSSL
jgi:Single-stranded DNA-specific exonuclease